MYKPVDREGSPYVDEPAAAPVPAPAPASQRVATNVSQTKTSYHLAGRASPWRSVAPTMTKQNNRAHKMASVSTGK